MKPKNGETFWYHECSHWEYPRYIPTGQKCPACEFASLDQVEKAKIENKNLYDRKIKKKLDVLKDNKALTNKEKHLIFSDQKKKCILCKKDGGTLFEDKNNILSAYCGAQSKCKLDIKIQRTKYGQIRNDIE